MTCNMKTPKDAIIGDTFHRKDEPVEPLMAVSRPLPMVFAGIYPIDQTDPTKMKTCLDKVCLNDYSVTISSESSLALGTGWRLGFLGMIWFDSIQLSLLKYEKSDKHHQKKEVALINWAFHRYVSFRIPSPSIGYTIQKVFLIGISRSNFPLHKQ